MSRDRDGFDDERDRCRTADPRCSARAGRRLRGAGQARDGVPGAAGVPRSAGSTGRQPRDGGGSSPSRSGSTRSRRAGDSSSRSTAVHVGCRAASWRWTRTRIGSSYPRRCRSHSRWGRVSMHATLRSGCWSHAMWNPAPAGSRRRHNRHRLTWRGADLADLARFRSMLRRSLPDGQAGNERTWAQTLTGMWRGGARWAMAWCVPGRTLSEGVAACRFSCLSRNCARG
jgi:hypothetical protein